jgi:drug/metabolite transporter (DMT)-like permease
VPARHHLDPRIALALGVAVLALSTSGPLIASTVAPALAIAFWRNAMAVGLLTPVALLRRRSELVGLARGRAGLFTVLAGVALAVHFATWIPSAKLTSVATATALVATQPVWQGLLAAAQGQYLSRLSWLGIAVTVGAAMATTGVDLTGSRSAVIGDLLALGGGVAAAVYTALGARARATTTTTSYTMVCYAVCAAVTLVSCLVAGVPLTGFPASAWVVFAALTLGPQLMGHSMNNFALRHVSATTVAVVVLLEVPGAALIGWIWLGQAPRPLAWPGLALLPIGVAIVILADRRRAPYSPTAATLLSHRRAAVAGSEVLAEGRRSRRST